MAKPRGLTPEEQALWEQVNSTVKTFANPPQDMRMSLVTRSKPQPTMFIATMPEWSPTLDLHDLTLAQAHAATLSHIRQAHARHQRKIIVITGRSGLIAKEFSTWVDLNSLVTKRTILNGGGAWKLWVRKKLG